MYGMWVLDYKESWAPKKWCFWTGVLEKTHDSLLSSRRWNQSILKEISPKYSLEGLILKLKLQYFGHLIWRTDSLEKTLKVGKIEGRRRKGMTEDEMVGWHHQLDGHEFEQALGVGEGQRNLACWVHGGTKSQTGLSNWITTTKLPSPHPFFSMWFSLDLLQRSLDLRLVNQSHLPKALPFASWIGSWSPHVSYTTPKQPWIDKWVYFVSFQHNTTVFTKRF